MLKCNLQSLTLDSKRLWFPEWDSPQTDTFIQPLASAPETAHDSPASFLSIFLIHSTSATLELHLTFSSEYTSSSYLSTFALAGLLSAATYTFPGFTQSPYFLRGSSQANPAKATPVPHSPHPPGILYPAFLTKGDTASQGDTGKVCRHLQLFTTWGDTSAP